MKLRETGEGGITIQENHTHMHPHTPVARVPCGSEARLWSGGRRAADTAVEAGGRRLTERPVSTPASAPIHDYTTQRPYLQLVNNG